MTPRSMIIIPVAVLTTFALAAGVVYLGAFALSAARAMALRDVVSEFQVRLEELDERSLRQYGIRLNYQWQELSVDQYDQLAEADVMRWRSEGGGNQGPLVDPWGARFHIASRLTPDGRVRFSVWSGGPDMLSGTDDDITGISRPKTPHRA